MGGWMDGSIEVYLARWRKNQLVGLTTSSGFEKWRPYMCYRQLKCEGGQHQYKNCSDKFRQSTVKFLGGCRMALS